jgi:hypothetical protein
MASPPPKPPEPQNRLYRTDWLGVTYPVRPGPTLAVRIWRTLANVLRRPRKPVAPQRRAFFFGVAAVATGAATLRASSGRSAAVEPLEPCCPTCLVRFPHPDFYELGLADKLAEHDANCTICGWRGRVRFFREAK